MLSFDNTVILFFSILLLSQEETGRAGRRAAQKGESKMGERPIGFLLQWHVTVPMF